VDAAVEALKTRYPNVFQVAGDAPGIARQLLGAVKDRGGTGEEARARRLAAEAMLAGCRDPEARSLLELVRTEGPSPADRAQAAYRLGLQHFLAQKYSLAERYWKIVPQLDPGSPWAHRVERYLPFLAIRSTGQVPAFEAEFALPGQPPVKKSKSDFKGRHAILHFWSAASGGAAETVRRLDKIRAGFPENGLEVLGINLDADAEAFARGVRAHGVTRLEHHQGKAFDTAIARLFGIPRTPCFLLMNPEGEALYLGGDLRLLEKALRGEK